MISKILRLGIVALTTFILGVAAKNTALQYIVWKYDPTGVGKTFIEIKYFLRYSFTQFMLNGFLTFIMAFWVFVIFYFFIRFSAARGRAWVDGNDLKLAVLGVLISGWPKSIIYLISIFVLALFWGIYSNLSRRQERFIALTAPILISIFLTLFLGNYIIKLYGA